jgi:NOL1/NOP2/fmu family ribosome biogenesis protein
MKHLLNNISEEEKNRIREQHEGGMNLAIDNFKKLVETKSGDAKPFISEASEETCEQCGGMLKEGECVEQCGSMKEEELDEQNAETLPSRKGIKLGPLKDNEIRELVKQIGECLDDNGKELIYRLNKDKRNHEAFFGMMMAEISRYVDNDSRIKSQG